MIEGPLLPDVGVLAFVPDEWEIPWQPRHQILTRLARYFHVVWVTPAQWWRTLVPRAGRRPAVAGTYGDAFEPGFSISRPPAWLPEIGRPQWLAGWAARERIRRAVRVLEGRRCEKTILYLWRPSFAPALRLVPHDVSCYHIDDEYTFSDLDAPISPVEEGLIRQVHQVFIHSPALIAKKGALNPNTLFVPNGVDYRAFSTPRPEPSDLASIPHPRIGYVGRIKHQLDFELLRTLAQRHVNWSFVFVGPVENLRHHDSIMRELAALPNVNVLGPKPVEQLPSYTQHLDVCLLCYVVNGYTKFIYPLKLHEYLASGRPVVASPIDSVLAFQDVIRLAQTPDEWSQALTELVRDPHSLRDVERRRRVGREHDWERLVRRVARSLAGHLGEPYVTKVGDEIGEDAIPDPAALCRGTSRPSAIGVPVPVDASAPTRS